MTTTATTFTPGDEVVTSRRSTPYDEFVALVTGVSPRGDRLIVRTELGGKTLVVDADACSLLADYEDAYVEGPTCSLCDAVGHGYPGAGPCPLEDRGAYEADRDMIRFGSY
jgi:hypothetical protein